MIDAVKVDFPPHDTDPAQKQQPDYCLKWAKAAYHEWKNSRYQIFNKGATAEGAYNYDTIAQFMEGRQPVDNYYPLMGVDENSDDTWMNLDWSILPVMPKNVRIITGLLNKAEHKVVFEALDSLAVDRKNRYFSKMKAKLIMREQIQSSMGEQAGEVIKQLGLDPKIDDAIDMEELEMQLDSSTWKDTTAIEWTKNVATVLAANKISELRKRIRKDVMYYGVGCYKDYIDSNGALRIRRVDPRSIIVSYCEEQDFSDKRYIGEIVEMTVADIAQSNQDISFEKLLEIADSVRGLNNNPGRFTTNEQAMQARIHVLDLEWVTIDELNYQFGTTKYGNMAVSKQPLDRTGPDFVRERDKMWYKCKWVIGTDHVWDYGRCTDIKRPKNQLAEVMSNYHIFAPMITDMEISSIGIEVQPILNHIQISWLRLQKTIGEYRSKGVSINLTSAENVSIGKGGKKLTPMELMDLFLQKNIHLYRSEDSFDPTGSKHQKPIEVVEGTGMDDVLGWFNALQNYITMLSDNIGLNSFTDATTPDPRALTTTVNSAVNATNNSLEDIMDADIRLLKSISEAVVVRLQDMVEMGLLDRMALSIGDGSIEFIKNNPGAAPADWAISVKRIPSDEERNQLIEQAKAMVPADLLSWEDIVLIKTSESLAEAEQILAFRMKRRRQQKLQESQAMQAQNAEVQAQSGIAVEKARQETQALKAKQAIEVATIQAEAARDVARINSGAAVAGKVISNQPSSEN